jgi:hypothetical protein
MNLNEARELTADIKRGLAFTQRKIAEAIEGRIWEPLGYDDFAAYWKGEGLTGTLIPRNAKGLLVCAMLADGASVNDVRRALGPGSGVTIPAIENAEEQFQAGVPVDLVSVRAKPHKRLDIDKGDTHIHQNPVRQSRYLTVDLGGKARHYHDLAKGHGVSLADVARDLLDRWAEGEFLK